MRKPDVFISHSHADADADRAWIREFVRALEAEKLSVWLDSEELKPGDRWAEGIERALRDSVAIIAIVGPSSVGSQALFWELGAALGMGKRVIPVVPKEFDASRLPSPLRTRQALQKGSPEQTAKLVAATIAATEKLEQRK